MDDSRIEALVRKSLKRDRLHDFDDLIRMLHSGEAHIFQNDHGCWIVQIIETKLDKFCHVWIVAGELPGVLELEPLVEAFSREHGCTTMTSVCRYGYGKRIASERGWKITGLAIEKPVPAAPEQFNK